MRIDQPSQSLMLAKHTSNTVASLYKQFATFQFQVHVQLAAGKVLLLLLLRGQSNISSSACPRSFSPFYHPSTLRRLPDTGSPFFNPLFLFLFLQLIPYFILLNDCDKEQKKESLCSFNPDMSFLVISFYNWLVGLQRWLLMGTTRVYIIIVIINNYICMEKYFRATLLVVTLTLNVNVHAVV